MTFSTLSRTMLSSCALSLLTYPVWAAEPVSSHAPTVVVTATRTPTELSKVGSSVTVITADTIEKRQLRTVSQALRTVPGVDVAQSGPGGTTTVFLRGTESSHVLVLIDGVELNDPSNTTNFYDFAHLTTDNVERIEVLRGSQGTLYGSEAIGGVIHIFTKQGDGKVTGSLSAEGGSFGTVRAAAGASGSSKRLRFSTHVSRTDSNGFSSFNEDRGGSEDDGTENTTVSARLGVEVVDNVDATVSMRYHDTETEYDDFGADAANLNESDQLAVRADIGSSHLNDRWKQRVGVHYMDITRKDATRFGPSTFDGERVGIDWVHTIQADNANTVLLGLETQDERFNSSFDSKQSARTNAAFVQDTIAVTDKLTTTIGARIDDHEEFGDETTWRIAPAYVIDSTNTILRASYGTGFRAPSLFQLYSAFGTTTLKPETSDGFDAGFEQAFMDDRVRMGATYFYTDIDDLIDYDFTTSRYQNIGDIRSEGIESFVAFEPLDKVLLHATYVWTNAQDRNSGLAPLRRAKHKGSVTAQYNFVQDAQVSATVRYVGERADNSLAFTRTTLDDFITMDLAASWQFHPQLELFGRVDNLFDEEYEEVLSYGTAGLSAYAGLKATF